MFYSKTPVYITMKSIHTLLIVLFSFCLTATPLQADEGMWMVGRLDKATHRHMKRMGLQLSARQLYHPVRSSLKDAVVSFGGFCSGVVVSHEGLLLTNHHCGFSSVQQLSSPAHDYLQDGFVATDHRDELPCPDLYVRFLLRQEDVTHRVLSAVTPAMDEAARTAATDSVSLLISEEVSRQDSTLIGIVDSYYGGSEFVLSVYRDYTDIRLVFAPPSSIGKFGWDSDNWMWPRHTGDFCLFRIYAGPDNLPADYAPSNVPYRPRQVAALSLDGYREGDFCMTMGYPGSTDRFLSSYGVEEQLATSIQAQTDIRGIKQAIWKRRMERNDTIRIQYASKYDESSNYWKHSIGLSQTVRRLHVLERKRALEQRLREQLRHPSDAKKADGNLLHLFSQLELAYKARHEAARAQAYLMESFLNGPELIQQALTILNFDLNADTQSVTHQLQRLAEKYADMDAGIDKEVFAALTEAYRRQVSPDYLPEFYQTIDTLYGGDCQAFADTLYARTRLATPDGLQRFLQRDSTYQLVDDPAISLCIDLLTKFFEINLQLQQPTQDIQQGERLLTAAFRRQDVSRFAYPDANSTMRLSFGRVCGYTPYDGAEYRHYTTTQGILQKARDRAGDRDFYLQPRLHELLSNASSSPYTDATGQMKVCFLSDTDITGGNSGSALFNARGELLGLAFDGNWEAMSSDLLYEPRLQRTIAVDIRYILFIIHQYGHAPHLVEEMTGSAARL